MMGIVIFDMNVECFMDGIELNVPNAIMSNNYFILLPSDVSNQYFSDVFVLLEYAFELQSLYFHTLQSRIVYRKSK